MLVAAITQASVRWWRKIGENVFAVLHGNVRLTAYAAPCREDLLLTSEKPNLFTTEDTEEHRENISFCSSVILAGLCG